jgi:hypothetical protein
MNDSRTFIAILLGALLIGVIAFYASPYSSHEPLGEGMGRNRQPGDLEIYYSMKAVLASVNAFLLVSLTVIYIQVYRETGLEFSLGMVIFSVALLFYAFASNPLLVRYAGFMGSGLGPFAMLPDLFTCIASITLLYLTK